MNESFVFFISVYWLSLADKFLSFFAVLLDNFDLWMWECVVWKYLVSNFFFLSMLLLLLCVITREINSSKLLYWLSYLQYEIFQWVTTRNCIFHFWKEKKGNKLVKKIWHWVDLWNLIIQHTHDNVSKL